MSFCRSEAGCIGDEELPALLSRAAARTLGVDGAGVCVDAPCGQRLPLGASDRMAAGAERLQFTAGEGPCFEAMSTGRPVTVDETSMWDRWPVLAALHHETTPFKAGLAVPLRENGVPFGVMDLYDRRPQRMGAHDVIAAQMIAVVIAEQLLTTLDTGQAEGLIAAEGSPAWLDAAPARRRREVWVAVGMINLVLGLAHDDALATLRGRAVTGGQTLDALAHAIVVGDVDPTELLA
nr:GAF domain-containing protein [Kineococcus siccus]